MEKLILKEKLDSLFENLSCKDIKDILKDAQKSFNKNQIMDKQLK